MGKFHDATKGEMMSDETTKDVKEVKDSPKASKKKEIKAEAPVEAEVVVSDDYVEAVQEAVADSVDGSLKFTPSIAVSGIVANGSTWIVTTTSANPFSAGQSVSIQGTIPAVFNGTFIIASITNNTTFVINNTTQNGVSQTTNGTVETAYPYNNTISGAYNMWNPWITAQNGDLISWNTNVNTKDWAGAIVFQNGQYNTTQRGF